MVVDIYQLYLEHKEEDQTFKEFYDDSIQFLKESINNDRRIYYLGKFYKSVYLSNAWPLEKYKCL